MKKLLAVMMMAAAMTACTSGNDLTEGLTQPTAQDDKTEFVTLSFQPYTIEAMTRAGEQAIGDIAKRIDVWVFEGDSATALTQTDTIAAVHQQNADDGFGSLTLTLNRTKTYTLYAIAHCNDTPATFSKGTVSFTSLTDNTVLAYTKTFTPADTKTLDCRMTRRIGLFRIIITDSLPASVVRLRIAATIGTRYSFPLRKGINPTQKGRNWTDLSAVKQSDGTTVLNYCILAADTIQHYDISVKGCDASSVAVKERIFRDVPIRNGYRTVYRGEFFTDAAFASTFTVDTDWKDFDTVTY